jgi:hypothetical protein
LANDKKYKIQISNFLFNADIGLLMKKLTNRGDVTDQQGIQYSIKRFGGLETTW